MKKEEYRDLITFSFDYLVRFAENIVFRFPEKKYVDAISKLEFLKNKIHSSELIAEDIIKYCYPTRDMLIQFYPPISKQLSFYWNMHMDILEKINQGGVKVQLNTIDENKVIQMGTLNKLHVKTMEHFLTNSNQSHLFALFYFHVLRVDTFENSIKQPLKKSLKKYQLNHLYDIESVFSIKHKVKTKNDEYITDIRAVRNCLAHFKFEILDNQNEWKIYFKSGEDINDRTIYHESFSKNQLIEFLNNSNMLYQGQFMLYLLLSAITHFKPFGKEPLLLHKHTFT